MTEILYNLLERNILQLLESGHQGLSEYQLLKLLEAREGSFAASECEHPQLDLFRRHFLLFHLLYRLQGRLWHERRGWLCISALRIAIEPCDCYGEGDGLIQHDPLRDYYLDTSELERTTLADVEQLLDGFWRRLAAWRSCREALEVLGINEAEPAMQTIRRRYKQLCMQHHPDRGGDTALFQRINRAMAQLEQIYLR